MSTQDLMQHARRLARRSSPVGVSLVHLRGSAYIKANTARYHYFRNTIDELAHAHAAEAVELEAGWIGVIAGADAVHARLLRLFDAAAADAGQPLSVDLERFALPGQYPELRERLSALDTGAGGPTKGGPETGGLTTAVATMGEVAASTRATPASAAQGHAATPLSGPLTPALLAVIEAKLDGIDLEPFVRRRPVRARVPDWQPIYTEQVIDRQALAAAFYPAVEVIPGEPLCCELRRHLDRLMLVTLLLNCPWRRQRIGLDLGQAAWTTDEYRRLIRRLDDAERRRLTIEIDWLDALRDEATGGKVLAEMREAGFRIAIDGIGIDVLPVVNLDRLQARWLKLVFDKTRLAALAEPAHLDALRRLDADRLILTGTDDERALDLGQRLGIRHYQGPLVERLAKVLV